MSPYRTPGEISGGYDVQEELRARADDLVSASARGVVPPPVAVPLSDWVAILRRLSVLAEERDAALDNLEQLRHRDVLRAQEQLFGPRVACVHEHERCAQQALMESIERLEEGA